MGILDKWAVKRVSTLVKSESRFSNAGSLTKYDRAFADFIKNFWKGGTADDYVGSVFNAIEVHSFYFSKAKFRLYKKSNDKVQEILDHPFVNMFNRPNSLKTWWEYAYKIPVYWGLWGSNYFHVKRNILDKKPFAFQQIPPALIEKDKDSKGIVKGYLFNDGVNKVPIPFEDIIILNYPNPYSEIDGFPIVNTIADQKTVNHLQMHYMKQFFENGGFMGLIFTTTQEMRKTNFDRTLAMLEEKFQGADKAYKEVGLFDSGLQPVKAAYSIKDMDITESRKITKEDIFEAWKVADIMVGRGNMDRAGNEAAIYQFTSGIVDPLLSFVDAVFTNFVRKEWKDNSLEIIHDTLAPRDVDAQLKFHETMLKMGALTVNQVLGEWGYNPQSYELCDIPMINGGGAIIRLDTGKQIGKEDAKSQAVGQGQDQSPKGKDDTTSEESFSEVGSSLVKNVGDEQWLVMKWKQFNTRLERQVRRFERSLGKYLDDQQRRILEATLNNFVVEEAFNLQDENMLLYQLLEIDLWDIMKYGYEYGNNLYDAGEFNKQNLRNEFSKIANNTLLINDTTLEQIKDAKDESELQKRYKEIQETRKGIIAVTTAAGAYNAALLQAMRDAGLTNKTWLSMRDGKVRANPKGENHRIMDGVTIPINEPFEVPSRSGKDLGLYPSDPSMSPENIINDRCTIFGSK